MRIVLQRVHRASVTVNKEVIGEISRGYLLFLGVLEGDTEKQADALAEKVAKVRLFLGDDGKINDKSIQDIEGEVLLVSQFTLAGRLEKGNRPDFTQAAVPERAKQLYEYFAERLLSYGLTVRTGEFGAMMEVSLSNDGPCTILLER
jgi:D-tyrosyl-tRNA(Tyr) deacylase